jgi:hypothetical protein
MSLHEVTHFTLISRKSCLLALELQVAAQTVTLVSKMQCSALVFAAADDDDDDDDDDCYDVNCVHIATSVCY